MGYHDNHCFLNIKMSVFATGRPHVSYVIKLKHMLYIYVLFHEKCTDFPFYVHGGGTLTPPYKI